jgi:hypothetical protein
MSIRTISEILFESFCTETGMPFTPIPPEPEAGRRTPDYELHLQVPPILVEVKQIDPNPDNKAFLHRFEEAGVSRFLPDDPGERLRGKISEASSQLKARAKPDQPALLIIYNNVPVRLYTLPFQIMCAMYGQHKAVITRSHGLAADLLSVSCRLGGSRRLTPEHNTTISALVVLFEGPEGPYLVVYHNQFAANPIPPKVLRRPRIFQWRICEVGPGEFPEWVEV